MLKLWAPSVDMSLSVTRTHGCSYLQKKVEQAVKREREAEKASRSYDSLFADEFNYEDNESSNNANLEEDFM